MEKRERVNENCFSGPKDCNPIPPFSNPSHLLQRTLLRTDNSKQDDKVQSFTQVQPSKNKVLQKTHSL